MAYSKYNNGGNNWRRSKDGNFNGGSKLKSHHCNNPRKPPFPKDHQLSAYELEESFCEAIGGISYKEVMENQRYMYQDDKIMQWKDSAAEEAFWNAKTRFWAEIHGQPCEIQLPDPDVFIDKIDWNSRIDPELMADLDNRESDTPFETEEHDSGVVIGIPGVLLQSELTPTGWGDAEDVKPQQGHDDYEKVTPTGWEDEYVYVTQEKRYSGDGQVHESAWNDDREQQHYAYDKRLEHGYYHKKWDNVYNQNKDHGGWNTSRYKISRNRHNTVQTSNYHTLRSSQFPRESSLFGWKPVTRRW